MKTVLKYLVTFFLTFLITNCPWPDTFKNQYDEVGCLKPVDLVRFAETEIKIALKNVGEIMSGEIGYEIKPQVIKLVSESAKELELIEWLICRAKRSGEIQTKEQADYLRTFLHFLKSKPSPDKIMEWRKNNPLPKETGLLEIDKNELTFVKGTKPIEYLKIINLGTSCKLHWWLIPPERGFFVSPDEGVLDPTKSQRVTVARLDEEIDINKEHLLTVKADSGREQFKRIKLIIQEIIPVAFKEFEKKVKNQAAVKPSNISELTYHLVRRDLGIKESSSEYFMSGHLLYNWGFYKDSVITLGHVTKYNPNMDMNPIYLKYFGLANYKIGMKEKANNAFEKWAAIDNSGKLFYAGYLISEGKEEEGKKYLEKAKELKVVDPFLASDLKNNFGAAAWAAIRREIPLKPEEKTITPEEKEMKIEPKQNRQDIPYSIKEPSGEYPGKKIIQDQPDKIDIFQKK